jgi:hypothetical protein
MDRNGEAITGGHIVSALHIETVMLAATGCAGDRTGISKIPRTFCLTDVNSRFLQTTPEKMEARPVISLPLSPSGNQKSCLQVTRFATAANVPMANRKPA